MSNNDDFYPIHEKYSYMIEHSHLKIIQELHHKGTLTEAAASLCLSQSALSHQIRYLEKKMEVRLWERKGRNLRLTQAGELLLQTAQQVLPVLEQTENMLKAYGEGRQGVLRIGVECYPCFEWLTSVIGTFLQQMPDVDIDIVNKFQFSGLEGLLNHHIDVLVTPDKERKDAIHYEELLNYELVLLTANQHKLTKQKTITPEHFSNETLLTFPVNSDRLDILTQFLNPAFIMPARIKKIESIDLMLQMVALNRGICVLPEWLADTYVEKMNIKKIHIGKNGIQKKLFVALRKQDREVSYINQFIMTGKTAANRLIHKP